MGIIGLTGSVGTAPTSLKTLMGGSYKRAEKSSFGPSFLLGSSTHNFGQDLYNSLGAMLGAGKIPANPGQNAPQAIRRAELLNQAATLIDLGDTTGGRALARELLDKNSSDVTALRLVAHSYLNEEDYKQAERYYGQALAFSPGDAGLQSDFNIVRRLQKSDEEVLAHGRRLIQAPTRRAEGLKLLLRLTDRSPNNTEAYLALTDGYAANRDSLEVMGSLQEAVKSAKGRQIDEVIVRAQALVQQQPDVGLTHNILGRALQKAGRFREGLVELKSAADIAPFNFSYRQDYAEGLVDRALGKLSRGDLVSARVDLETVQGISPSNERLAEASARLAGEQARRDILGGQFIRALVQLNIAYNKAPDDDVFKRQVSGLLMQTGAHFLADGEDGSALSAYIKAFDFNPDSATARRYVGELSHSQGLAALNDLKFDAAITHLERAYDTYRTNDTYKLDLADALDQRGALYVSVGKFDEAIEDFKRGLLLDPTNSSLNANYTAALAQQE